MNTRSTNDSYRKQTGIILHLKMKLKMTHNVSMEMHHEPFGMSLFPQQGFMRCIYDTDKDLLIDSQT